MRTATTSSRILRAAETTGRSAGGIPPEEEFDEAKLVLRLKFRGDYDEPARAFYARPEADEAPVRQADKIRIGWQYIPAGLDPGHQLAFYSSSVLARLFERGDISEPLDAIRKAIDEAKGPLLKHPDVKATRERLQDSAQRLGLAPAGDPLDLAVAGLSDRRVLQSLQLVLQSGRSQTHLPLAAHGRGVLRVLLIAALLQGARADGGNLILALEEPEQNLEPVGQRLVTRSLLLAEEADAAQVLLTTHSAEVAGTVPLAQIHLARDADPPVLKALRDAEPSEHKFFELHSRSALIDGLYASVVVLAEGPTERGALPALWAAHKPGEGLDEHRIELVDCESIDKMPSFVRFFKALGIPVIAVADTDRPEKLAKVAAADPDVLLSWKTHKDWEGVLAAEADILELAAGIETCRASLGEWEEHADQLRGCLIDQLGDAPHLVEATDVQTLIAGYEEQHARSALAHLLRGHSGLDFKSTIYARTICTTLTVLPPTAVGMIDHVHRFVAGDEDAKGVHDL
ncbi:MAG TPA: TOPRIM nucleotidyl transferase/hydrolase domain-containing protein [Solirubrobacteraceae bacterium]|nr:TOPRIM nucleotidyl transferase/hydrolase domain-containing protein [Solirubrobacteraceae bacterium]